MVSKLSTKQQHRSTEKSFDRLIRRLFAINWYRQLSGTWRNCLPIAAAIIVFWNFAAVAQKAPPDAIKMAEELKVNLDTAWVTIAAMLVIFMNAGFCMLETGFCREKNAVNVLAKNLIVFALSSVAFWVLGFGLMFSTGNDFIGTEGFFLTGADNSPAMGDAYKGAFASLNWTGVPLSTKFFFQLAFAGTAATIVSGAVAERIKFGSFLIFSLLLVAIVYPITGHWIWGGGWLADMGFYDFAGSTVVHAVGGWSALIGAWMLGARIGKYNSDGSANAIPGHNMSIATLGCLILWFGWFGFNPGSTMGVSSAIGHIAVTTNTGGAFGGIAATIVAWVVLGKPDLSMIINGILAGLVAVTASCAWISVPSAAIIGTVAGILVVFAVSFFDKIRIDDPVGATSVHLVNGIWGTLAVGLFSQGDAYGVTPAPKPGVFFGGGFEQLSYQLVGTLAVGGVAVALCLLFWAVLKATMGIRVTPEEEYQGLDISEHGMEAYPGSSLGGGSDYSKEIHAGRKSARGSAEYPEASGNP